MSRRKADYVRLRGIKPTRLAPRDVNQITLDIWREHSRRLGSSFGADQPYGVSKNEDAKNFLRREVYALGLVLKTKPQRWNLSKLLVKERSHATTRRDVLGQNIFHDLLMSIYEDDSQISRQERWTMAKELEYAYRHSIPPEFLCGFIYQSGGRKNLLKKLDADYIEPAFRSDEAVE